MSKIIILGGSGFIGKFLISTLLKKNQNILALKHQNSIASKCITFDGDILESGLLDNVIEENDLVINLIGQLNDNSPNFINTNILGNLNILESCRKKKSSLLLISSSHVYGNNEQFSSKEDDIQNPQTLYGIIKSINEKICKHFSSTYNQNITILRLSNVYGPSKISGIIAQFFDSLAKKNSPVILYNNGEYMRDFIYLDDAVNGILKSIEKFQPGFNVFNISTGTRISMIELAKKIENISNITIPLKYSPINPDEQSIWADNKKAKNILNFYPKIPLDKGLSLTYESYKTRN